ncbi:protein of unknown function [Candidatus Methylocalor cossyra]|uniref:Uncharacterized protein n=1 Tax=Candidatus Methylocalor cossyra TaxID=3108543 RepID=A0ABM9NM28_9GAMM
MSVPQQPADHVGAHPAEADHTQLHRLYSLVEVPKSRGAGRFSRGWVPPRIRIDRQVRRRARPFDSEPAFSEKFECRGIDTLLPKGESQPRGLDGRRPGAHCLAVEAP